MSPALAPDRLHVHGAGEEAAGGFHGAFGDGGVGVDEVGDVFDGQFRGAGEERLVDQVGGAFADDGGAEDFAAVGGGDNLRGFLDSGVGRRRSGSIADIQQCSADVASGVLHARGVDEYRGYDAQQHTRLRRRRAIEERNMLPLRRRRLPEKAVRALLLMECDSR